MLYQSKKILFLAMIIMSCQEKREEENSIELNRVYRMTSIKTITEPVYDEVYKQVSDSLTDWITAELKSTLNLKVNTWKLDSLICFNRNKDKFITTISVQLTKYTDTNHDGIHLFYGVKVKDQWYFFYGPYMVILRDKENLNSPTSFTKLHEIAMKNIFSGYLKKNKETGEWEINDAFFARFYERDAYNFPFTTQEAWDESWLRLMRENWKHRDTTNYEPVQ